LAESEINTIKAELGKEFIIKCPSGACDDGFMINYARDLETDKQEQGSSRARIVTNDHFRDHHGLVDRAWVREHTVKYTFVGVRFVPQPEGM